MPMPIPRAIPAASLAGTIPLSQPVFAAPGMISIEAHCEVHIVWFAPANEGIKNIPLDLASQVRVYGRNQNRTPPLQFKEIIRELILCYQE
jgi:hypothetical protein